MIDYTEAIRTVIQTGDYDLTALEDRIDTLWVEGKLDADTRAELKVLAAEHSRETIADLTAAIQSLEARVLKLEDEQYAEWVPGYTTTKGEIVRCDVTGDGTLDLCQYDGGRATTSIGVGRINGWFLLDRSLTRTHTITRDADGGYVLTPIEGE